MDRRLWTGVEEAWAAGDCGENFHRVSRRPVTIALGTYANKQGRTAGITIAGGYATFPGVLGTAVAKICDVQVSRTGLALTRGHPAGRSWAVCGPSQPDDGPERPRAVQVRTCRSEQVPTSDNSRRRHAE